MRLLERYSQAVNSGNLTVDERTTWSDTDVLGAMGLSGAEGYRNGLGGDLGPALVRLFADGKLEPTLTILSGMAFKRARTLQVKVNQVQAADLAKAVLAHHRHGACQPCGGTGYSVIPGTPIQGDECPACKGGGKMPFDPLFTHETRDLAHWLSREIDRVQAVAGGAAMTMLADRMEL